MPGRACLATTPHVQSRSWLEATSHNGTHLFQHDLGVFKVLEHGLDVGLIGRARQEAARDSLHALHLEGVGGKQLQAKVLGREEDNANAASSRHWR